MTLKNDLTIKFSCSSFVREEPILSKAEYPLKKSGLFLNRANLEKGANYSIAFKYGNKTIFSVTEQLPFDWKNPLDWAFNGYSKLDKKLIKKIPLIGEALEGLLPDAKWHFDLWYDININEDRQLDYKIHFGPTPTIDVRKKYENKYQLSE